MKITALALALLAGVATGSAAKADVISNFNVDADGWIVFQNSGAPVYSSSGGNPGGYISVNDYTSDWAYLQAPSKFLAPATYNGTLSFDLKIDPTSNPGLYPNIYNVRVGLQGGGLTLIAESSLPTAAWSNYSFSLNELSNWRKFSNLSTNYSSGAPAPTQAEIQNVLANLTRLVVATDYSNAATNDTPGFFDVTYLDNVRLSTLSVETPIPAALPLLATGLAGLGWLAHRGRRKATAA